MQERHFFLAGDIMEKIAINEDFNSSQPFYEILNTFIGERRRVATIYATKLSDKKEVTILREVITASVNQRIAPEQQKEANLALKDYLIRENMEQIIIREGLRIRAEGNIQNCIKLSSWIQRVSESNIVISSQEDSSKYLLKAEADIKCTLEKAIEVFNSWSWINLNDLETIEKHQSNNQEDFYFAYKFPLPFSDRDFLVSRRNEIEPGKFKSVIFSTTHPDKPVIKKRVRANILAICTMDIEKEKVIFKLCVQVGLKSTATNHSKIWKGFYKMIKNMKNAMEQK